MTTERKSLALPVILALKPGEHVEVHLAARTYTGPLIDPRSSWVPARVHGVNETLNGEINLWVDIDYPNGLTGRDGSLTHRQHFTANGLNVRMPEATS